MNEKAMVDLLNDEMNELIENLSQVKELKSEIEELKQTTGGCVTDQGFELEVYQGTQAENKQLKQEIERLMKENSRLNLQLQFQVGEVDKKDLVIEHLQKQVDELKQEKLNAVCDLNMRIVELDSELKLEREWGDIKVKQALAEFKIWKKQAVKDTVEKCKQIVKSKLYPNNEWVDRLLEEAFDKGEQ